MPYIHVRRPDRELMSQEHVPAHMRGRVSGTARGYEEADEIVRRHDRRSEGGPAIDPVLITDERENDRVEMEGHARAVGEAGAEQIVMGRKPHRRRVFYGRIS